MLAMFRSSFQQGLIAAATLLLSSFLPAQTPVADRPPLGWNSWDSYGLSVTEAEWKSNVAWFHEHLQPAGWQYVVLDEGWFLQHPENAESQGGKGDQGYTMDANGQFIPAPNRFPEGLAGLARYAHGLGLKFGIHIIRGIPKQAVERNATIVGTSLRAAEAADTTDLCRWNPDNYGIRNNAAGQAYYDGLIELYAGWGVDFLKVDCITTPYKADEIAMIHRAIAKTGRPMVLSLSPGPTPLEQAADLRANAQMWRISDDVWDVWSNDKPVGTFPQPVLRQFDNLARWMPQQQPGRWPDADMLPIGSLEPRPGWGKARESRLSADETQTMLTLWAIARSPLILGSNLVRMSPELTTMLTNREWLAVNQAGSKPRQVYAQGGIVAWRSDAATPGTSYLAVFNLTDNPRPVQLSWRQVQLKRGQHRLRNLWLHTEADRQQQLQVALPAHGSALYTVR